MRQAGFTLLEVLIAMAVTAFIAAVAYTGIATVIGGAEQLREVGERTRDMNRAFALLDRDMRQFVHRPVRDEFGFLQPALMGGPLAPVTLALTRDGWHNNDLPRSELQRVHYYVEEGQLWRAYYTVLDRAVDSEPQETVLLDGVEALDIRFLQQLESLSMDRNLVADTRNWPTSWMTEPGASPIAPPVALELRLSLEDLGELRRLYVLPPAY